MKVILLSTYELGRQPFGLASPAAWLRNLGHVVTTADLAVQALPARAIKDADAVGFYVPMHTATRLAVPVIARVRELNPEARLVAYGLYAPLNSEYLRSLGIHAAVGGEFEASLAAALQGEAAPEISLERLRLLPPDRSSLPGLGQYAKLHWNGSVKKAGSTEASRGCKHLCRHCPIVPIYEGTFRVVPKEVVLEDVRRQVAAGAEHITFGDPDFFNGPTHGTRIVEALHAEHPSVTYDVTIKVEHLLQHRELLPILVKTGCLWVTTAVESTEDHVLVKLAKGHTRADFLQALAYAREAGLHLSPTFVPFTPWSTLEGYRDLLRVLTENDLVDSVPPIQLSLRLLIPEGSKILNSDDMETHLTGFEPTALLWRWRHPDEKMDVLAARVFARVSAGQRGGESRRGAFQYIWRLAHGAAPPENFDLMPRATVPYLDEPWYC
jgi:radical SAM superfamily enzyme YgiQ (UPF0313 family)